MTTTQKKQIKEDLMAGKRISPIQALRNYGCFRLGARIYELREEGMDIKTTMVHSLTNPRKKYAVYHLSAVSVSKQIPVTPSNTNTATSLWSRIKKIFK